MARNKNFLKSMDVGSKGEEALIKLLNEKGVPSKKGDGRKSDVILGCGRVVEVKYDLMSAKTSNIAVEYFNSKSVKPSGITATSSDFWCFVLPCGSIFITKTSKLLEFFNTEKGVRDVFGAGDENADIRLYRKDHILPAIFYRIDDKTQEEIITWIS